MLPNPVSSLPVLTALRAWLTVICPVMFNKTLAWGLVCMWAADTTAVGTTLGLPAIPFPWSFWAGPPAVEGLTMVTPRLVWPAVDTGTLAWEAFVIALPRQKNRQPHPLGKWGTEQLKGKKKKDSQLYNKHFKKWMGLFLLSVKIANSNSQWPWGRERSWNVFWVTENHVLYFLLKNI